VITKPCAPSLLLAEVERQLARRRGSEVVEEG
jgi:hypothetical protein